MARKPKTEPTREEQKAKRDAAEQEALLREVDDAVRQGDMESFMSSYGKPLIAVIGLGLVGFAGYLYWDGQQEASTEAASERFITALDQLEAGRNDAASEQLAAVENGAPAVTATMLRAGLAVEQGDDDTAVALFSEVIDDGDAPQALRDLALIRRTALTFDDMEPEEVVAAMQPLAIPGEAFFSSAGELLGHAYLAQDKRNEAGALFAEIARDDTTPESARARMRNMAGILGVDAVDDVQEILTGQRVGGEGAEATLVNQ